MGERILLALKQWHQRHGVSFSVPFLMCLMMTKKNSLCFTIFGSVLLKRPLLHVVLFGSPSTELSKSESDFEFLLKHVILS